ncbi:hypothetical protein NC652_012474 [Populus alba x Populus x berolinensis]|nr:hypothetical protein NC652_012474 [Populus alba x Populus x berolinensis]
MFEVSVSLFIIESVTYQGSGLVLWLLPSNYWIIVLADDFLSFMRFEFGGESKRCWSMLVNKHPCLLLFIHRPQDMELLSLMELVPRHFDNTLIMLLVWQQQKKNSNMFASGGLGGEVIIWDVEAALTLVQSLVMTMEDDCLNGVNGSTKSLPMTSLRTISFKQTLFLCTRLRGMYQMVPKAIRSQIYAMAMNDSGTRLVSGGIEKNIFHFTFGRYCLSGSSDRPVNVCMQRCVHSYAVHTDSVFEATWPALQHSAMYNIGGRRFFSVSKWVATTDSSVHRWPAEANNPQKVFKRGGSFLAGHCRFGEAVGDHKWGIVIEGTMGRSAFLHGSHVYNQAWKLVCSFGHHPSAFLLRCIQQILNIVEKPEDDKRRQRLGSQGFQLNGEVLSGKDIAPKESLAHILELNVDGGAEKMTQWFSLHLKLSTVSRSFEGAAFICNPIAKVQLFRFSHKGKLSAPSHPEIHKVSWIQQGRKVYACEYRSGKYFTIFM